MEKVNCALIGSGNIGTDLLIKLKETSPYLDARLMVGIDPESDGLQKARTYGVATTHKGIEDAQTMDVWQDIHICFDATYAGAHAKHNDICKRDNKIMIDLTPAAIGPFCVPVVNLKEHINQQNVNMITCGGQATIPMVYAVSRVSDSVPYAEIVASVASRSAGPGTRANIDEFTETTAKGVEMIGGAQRGKAIIILNPAEPPMIMRDTIYAFSVGGDEASIRESVAAMIEDVKNYVPGYRLKQDVQFEHFTGNEKLHIPGQGTYEGIKTTIFLEVEGAGHYLPNYAGNLDIMTSAAQATAEKMAQSVWGLGK